MLLYLKVHRFILYPLNGETLQCNVPFTQSCLIDLAYSYVYIRQIGNTLLHNTCLDLDLLACLYNSDYTHCWSRRRDDAERLCSTLAIVILIASLVSFPVSFNIFAGIFLHIFMLIVVSHLFRVTCTAKAHVFHWRISEVSLSQLISGKLHLPRLYSCFNVKSKSL